MDVKYLAQDDTAPRLEATLEDANGDPVDLSGADVDLLLWDAFSGLLVIEDEVVIDDDPTTGKVTRDWILGESELAGVYRGRFRVTFGGGEIESFPNSDVFTLQILRTPIEAAS